MPLALLRRTPIANVAPATGYTVFVDSYDTDARRPYRDTYQSTTNTGVNAPFELSVGTLVPGASFCVNQTLRQVKYAGGGVVSTHDVPNAPACASSLGGLTLAVTHCTSLYSNDANIVATWAGGAGPLRVRCALLAPGLDGSPEYYAEQVLPAGATTARFLPLSSNTAPVATLTGDDARYRRQLTPTPALGLGTGRYRVEVLEETGGIIAGEVTVLPSRLTNTVELFVRQNAAGEYDGISYSGLDRYFTEANGPLSVVARYSASLVGGAPLSLLRLFIEVDTTRYRLLSCRTLHQSDTAARVQATFYARATGSVVAGEVNFFNNTAVAGAMRSGNYFLPVGAAAAEVGGITTVYSNGQGGTSFVIGETSVPRLELANILYFHPARPAEASGGVVVEVNSPAQREAGAVAYRLLSGSGTTLATNTTGRFGGLLAGAYTVRATLGAAVLDTPVLLQTRYGLKWRLEFVDERVHKPCRLELWARGYTGPVLALVGQAEPVTLETEGFAGGNTQPDLPNVIGSSATLRLRTAPGALAELLADDRAGRADVYYDDVLRFSGYLQPDIYTETAVKSKVDVELTATDGLAALRDVDFAGHVGQELRGRWPVLHTLLHALNRTDLTLPVALFTNRRALEMSSDEQPETALYTDRLGYLNDSKPMDLRAVVDALAQQQGGTLVQRGGRWEIRSGLEAAAATAGRTYDAAGDHAGTETAPSPAGRLTPERVAKLDTGAAHPLYWGGATQHRQRRAGWRYLTATGDATYATNALRQGEYFSTATTWDASGTALLPTAGWTAGERNVLASAAFPLRLLEAGGTADELATDWPLASSPTDARYLESELAPLATGREGMPIELSVRAKFYFGRELSLTDDVLALIQARLWVEIVAADAGGLLLRTMGAVLRFQVVRSLRDDFTTATAQLQLPVLPATARVRVRVHAYTFTSPLRLREGEQPTAFLLQAVTVKPLPQGAAWKAADAYYASGAGGSVRPAGLDVFHVDAPPRAGLYEGVAYAFRRSVTRGPGDQPATQWARADDLQPAPLLAAAVLDTLALRANPSQVFTGVVRHTQQPPEILDSIDLPYDASGKRFAVGARSWAMKAGETEVSLVEIGEGEHLTLPTLPPRVRLLHGLVGGRIRIRLRHPEGIRAIHP